MKILILGARGMLGHDLLEVFKNYQPIGWDKEDLDIARKKEVEKKIVELKPNIIINAAAYTNVDLAEKEKKLALKVNGYALNNLCEACKKTKSVLVHYSTDYVFSGGKQKGYKEEDRPDKPLNWYGRSKLLGEKLILAHAKKNRNFIYYLIRTSWLFGKHGKNFVSTMLKLAREKKEIKVVNDQFGKPTYSLDLAKATKELIEKKFKRGIYHLVNEGATNWFEFAKKIFEIKNIKIKVLPISSKELKRLAKRPKYSILLNTKFPSLRRWEEALEEYLISNI